jgi:hypothetical protein
VAELYRPLCGNREVHDPHDWWQSGELMFHCLGLTAQQAEIHEMINAVYAVTRDVPETWKESLRLEIHPGVHNLILRELSPTFGESVLGEEPKLTMPVVISMAGLSWGEWRIVLARGGIRDDRVG